MPIAVALYNREHQPRRCALLVLGIHKFPDRIQVVRQRRRRDLCPDRPPHLAHRFRHVRSHTRQRILGIQPAPAACRYCRSLPGRLRNTGAIRLSLRRSSLHRPRFLAHRQCLCHGRSPKRTSVNPSAPPSPSDRLGKPRKRQHLVSQLSLFADPCSNSLPSANPNPLNTNRPSQAPGVSPQPRSVALRQPKRPVILSRRNDGKDLNASPATSRPYPPPNSPPINARNFSRRILFTLD